MTTDSIRVGAWVQGGYRMDGAMAGYRESDAERATFMPGVSCAYYSHAQRRAWGFH